MTMAMTMTMTMAMTKTMVDDYDYDYDEKVFFCCVGAWGCAGAGLVDEEV